MALYAMGDLHLSFGADKDMTENIDFTNKFTAIKLHFGEPGNLGYLRPQYAKVIADLVKEAGGVPFLTDCNTLYVGGRKNALEHIQAAYMIAMENTFFGSRPSISE